MIDSKYLKQCWKMFDLMLDGEDVVISDLESQVKSNHMILPLDLIDLRGILERNCMKSVPYLTLFSFEFAKKNLSDHSIFLVVDIKETENTLVHEGGLCVIDKTISNSNKRISKIIINKDHSNIRKRLTRILKDTNVNAEIYDNHSIAGLSMDDSEAVDGWYKKETDIKRTEPLNNLLFNKGDKVRDRRKGLANPQEYGVVKRIDSKEMVVEWGEEKKAFKYDLMKDIAVIQSIMAVV